MASAYLAMAVLVAAIALARVPSPSVAALLYTAVAVWAERIAVPPEHAGWSSRLFATTTLILLGAGAAFVVPAVLVALLVRAVRRRQQPAQWQWPVAGCEMGLWIVASALATMAAQAMTVVARASVWGSVLFRPDRGEPGVLHVALGWAGAVTVLSVLMGTRAARAAGYAQTEIAPSRRAWRALTQTLVTSVIVYAVVALCDASLGSAGPTV